MARILHVAECYFGGVSRAIRTLVELTPEHDHFLIYDGRDEDFSPGLRSQRRFRTSGLIARGREIKALSEELRPDYLHLHSSWAGAYGRMFTVKAKVIYQPHCYKFDDSGLNGLVRLIFRTAEKALSLRSNITVVLSPHEKRLTNSLNPSVACVYVPNAPSCSVRENADIAVTKSGRPRVLMVGRICAQKDPRFFAEVARLMANEGLSEQPVFRWIGDGDEDLKQALETAGVEISGWKTGEGLLAELDSADVYVHSASYEGFPLSILDAAARGLPVIARAIDALEGSDVFQVETPQEIVTALRKALEQPSFRRTLINNGRRMLEAMNEDKQRVAWSNVYSNSEGA